MAGDDDFEFESDQAPESLTNTPAGDSETEENPLPSGAGIVPRTLADLFDRITALKRAGHAAEACCSMLEIHNERVHDLLEDIVIAGGRSAKVPPHTPARRPSVGGQSKG